MIEETAIVARCNGDYAWVEKGRQSACGQCNAKQGCGVSMLDRWFGQRIVQIKALNTVGAKDGDRVVLGIAEQALVKAALLMYLLPLAGLLLAAVLGARWAEATGGNVDLASIVGGLAGLIMGLFAVRYYFKRMGNTTAMQAVILKRLDQND